MPVLADAVGGAFELELAELLRQRLYFSFVNAASGAGADWSSKVPADTAREILAVTFTLTTSAVVGNRQVSVQAKDPNGLLLGQVDAPAVQVASTAVVYSLAFRVAQPASVVVQRFQLPVTDFALPTGAQLNSLTANLDVGDQFSNVMIAGRAWSLTAVAQAAGWYGRREWV